MKTINRIKILAFSLLIGALLLAACAPSGSNQEESLGTIAVGSKDFTEQFIVAEMFAQILEDAGFTVDRKLNLGGTPIAHEAILNGDIDLYPEYTSTGLLTVLKLSPIQDAQEIYATVKENYEEQYNLTWLAPSPFNNTQALAMTKETAGEYGIRTYSDLSEKAPELILGGPAEFIEREDGIKGLQEAYGGFEFKEVKQLGTGSLRYQALMDGQIDVVVAFGTDGAIQGNDLVVLVDDQVFYPIYNIAPVVRMDTLEEFPQISDLLNELAPLLTDDVMSGLNWQVDGPEGRESAVVAREFLLENGLIE
ncbi:MAG: glycine betaine ABC transporter substrate-binding protein [Brevefilum sp.]|nr:glycine betaine ABC transporter substrate-binding protein [Brevefilum sp.]